MEKGATRPIGERDGGVGILFSQIQLEWVTLSAVARGSLSLLERKRVGLGAIPLLERERVGLAALSLLPEGKRVGLAPISLLRRRGEELVD